MNKKVVAKHAALAAGKSTIFCLVFTGFCWGLSLLASNIAKDCDVINKNIKALPNGQGGKPNA